MTKQPKLIEKSPCESKWLVDGGVVRLWIIVGGTPALAFEDYSYQKRFPSVPQYATGYGPHPETEVHSRWHYRYPHQQEGDTPTPEEVLPNGWQDMYDFIAENVPKRIAAYEEARRAEAHLAEIRRMEFEEEKRIKHEKLMQKLAKAHPYRPYGLKELGYRSGIPEITKRRLTDEQRQAAIAELKAKYGEEVFA